MPSPFKNVKIQFSNLFRSTETKFKVDGGVLNTNKKVIAHLKNNIQALNAQENRYKEMNKRNNVDTSKEYKEAISSRKYLETILKQLNDAKNNNYYQSIMSELNEQDLNAKTKKYASDIIEIHHHNAILKHPEYFLDIEESPYQGDKESP
ncbi:MAG: hypothetical protein ACD_46C00019G0001, partial [uncultured bacterium]